MGAKRLTYLFGSVLAASAIIWFVHAFVQGQAWRSVAHAAMSESFLWRLILAVAVQWLGLIGLTLAWAVLQRALLPGHAPLTPLFAAYATSQFAKYLPGNVAHYVSRHVLARRLGAGHGALIAAAAGEAGLLVLAALALAGPALGIAAPGLSPYTGPWMTLVTVLAILALVLVVISLAQVRWPWWQGKFPRLHWQPLVVVFLLELVLFASMAAGVAIMATGVPVGPATLRLIPAAVATSWLAGFAVPGAPAGVGVREVVFMAILGPSMVLPDVLLLAAAFRVSSIAADACLFAVGAAMSRAISARNGTEK